MGVGAFVIGMSQISSFLSFFKILSTSTAMRNPLHIHESVEGIISEKERKGTALTAGVSEKGKKENSLKYIC